METPPSIRELEKARTALRCATLALRLDLECIEPDAATLDALDAEIRRHLDQGTMPESQTRLTN